jgi:predicted nucleotidyltransferase
MTPLRSLDDMMNGNLLVKHYAGSHSYGMALPTSDVDFRGIFVADPLYIRTPFYTVGELSDVSEEDTKFYEMNKFMKLALDCNPNVVETLWTSPQHIVHDTPQYQLLRSHAPEFLTTKIAFTTSGYALGQLKRIKGHNKWINSPQPEEAPQQVDYIKLIHNFTAAKVLNSIDLRDYFTGYRLVPFSGETYGLYRLDGYSPFNPETGALNTDYQGDSHELGTPDMIVKFNKQQYLADKDIWSNYWTWKKNRNAYRSELEEQFGYDTKHAAHLVRLLRMGAEALETGKLNVFRHDATELLSIRHGAWTYEEVVEYAEHMDNHVRNVLLPKSQLPKKPDTLKAANLILTIQDMTWHTPQPQ